MKKIRELTTSTSGLAEYLNSVEAKANWDAFRDHNQGASHKELIEKLIDLQHRLCGYCEINLTETDRQIEHVVPRNDPQHGTARELDVTNMIACCKGGTSSTYASSERSNELVARSNQYDNPDEMNAWIRSLLTPDENGRLVPFFTTPRSYFGPLSEPILAQPPQTWI